MHFSFSFTKFLQLWCQSESYYLKQSYHLYFLWSMHNRKKPVGGEMNKLTFSPKIFNFLPHSEQQFCFLRRQELNLFFSFPVQSPRHLHAFKAVHFDWNLNFFFFLIPQMFFTKRTDYAGRKVLWAEGRRHNPVCGCGFHNWSEGMQPRTACEEEHGYVGIHLVQRTCRRRPQGQQVRLTFGEMENRRRECF